IGNDEINMVERDLSHGRRLTQWLAKATRQLLQENGQSTVYAKSAIQSHKGRRSSSSIATF
ncbi:MAG: hypothetical protein WBL39_20335, partial [Terrimicrobiaceae bacterium]